MTSRAFDLETAALERPPLEAELAALRLAGSESGGGCPDLSLAKFFDIYFQVARAVMTHPILPPDLVGSEQPAI